MGSSGKKAASSGKKTRDHTPVDRGEGEDEFSQIWGYLRFSWGAQDP